MALCASVCPSIPLVMLAVVVVCSAGKQCQPLAVRVRYTDRELPVTRGLWISSGQGRRRVVIEAGYPVHDEAVAQPALETGEYVWAHEAKLQGNPGWCLQSCTLPGHRDSQSWRRRDQGTWASHSMVAHLPQSHLCMEPVDGTAWPSHRAPGQWEFTSWLQDLNQGT